MLIKKYILCLLLLVLMANSTYAQTETDSPPQTHEKLYQIELIIFARTESNPQEYWPHDLKLGYPENLYSLNPQGNTPEGFLPVPTNERLLAPQAATLARSGSYTLLYHQAWRQMIYGRKTNLAISGGKTVGDHQELEGSIALSVGQYLKIQTNLWLTQFAVAGTNITETWPELPQLPNSGFSDTQKNSDFLIKRIVKISQERSMRSNEIHYIDHPLLGIIIKIVPYDPGNAKPNS